MNAFEFVKRLNELNQARRLVLTQTLRRSPVTGLVSKKPPLESILEINTDEIEELVRHKYYGIPISPGSAISRSGSADFKAPSGRTNNKTNKPKP